MLLVSCREKFTSDWRFGPANRLREFPTHQIGRYVERDMSVLDERAAGQHVLILVHGYRNPLRAVLEAYAEMRKKLGAHRLLTEAHEQPHAQYGLVLGFAWPGFRTRSVGFVAARPSANRAGGFLRSLVQQVSHTARTVDIQTHSLGARVALQALSTTDVLWVDNLMLTAPAVDNECLQPAQEFHEAIDSCGRVFVYHSTRDRVLKSYALASADRALGRKGPQDPPVILKDCPNVYVIDCSRQISAHGHYRKVNAYYQHWARVLSQAPLDRFATL